MQIIKLQKKNYEEEKTEEVPLSNGQLLAK
jgi:hypothetical protein